MKLDTKFNESVSIIHFCEKKLVATNMSALQVAVQDMIRNHTSHIVLDLAEIETIDSTGLGTIVSISKDIGKNKTLRIAGLNGRVKKMFQITRLDRVLNLYDRLEEAIPLHQRVEPWKQLEATDIN